MVPTQAVMASRRLPVSTAILAAVVFTVGALTGVAIQGALDHATTGGSAAAPIHVVDMSTDVYAATHPTRSEAFVAAESRGRDMSAAAYTATHLADDMSAAAYRAMHP
jgi:hypothetical protein